MEINANCKNCFDIKQKQMFLVHKVEYKQLCPWCRGDGVVLNTGCSEYGSNGCISFCSGCAGHGLIEGYQVDAVTIKWLKGNFEQNVGEISTLTITSVGVEKEKGGPVKWVKPTSLFSTKGKAEADAKKRNRKIRSGYKEKPFNLKRLGKSEVGLIRNEGHGNWWNDVEGPCYWKEGNTK